MALISMRQMLDHAAEHGYGVPAFNVNNLEQMRAIMEAADKTDFLYTIESFEFPELQALAVEMGFIPRLFAAIPKIGKVAVVVVVGGQGSFGLL